jgi:hypothetical protein
LEPESDVAEASENLLPQDGHKIIKKIKKYKITLGFSNTIPYNVAENHPLGMVIGGL